MCLVISVFLPICDNKRDVLVVGQDNLCVSLWWDIKVAQVVFGPKFSFRAWNLKRNMKSQILIIFTPKKMHYQPYKNAPTTSRSIELASVTVRVTSIKKPRNSSQPVIRPLGPIKRDQNQQPHLFRFVCGTQKLVRAFSRSPIRRILFAVWLCTGRSV